MIFFSYSLKSLIKIFLKEFYGFLSTNNNNNIATVYFIPLVLKCQFIILVLLIINEILF